MKFGYTILYVDDVEQTLSFYEQAFGLERKFLHPGGDYGELKTGETTLAFSARSFATTLVGELGDGERPTFEIALVTDDVETAYARALTAGAISISEPAEKPWGQTVGYVRDLNRVVVEICSPVG